MISRDFWGSNAGRIVLTIIFCALLWGITLMLWMSDSSIAIIVVLVCAYFGWRELIMFTPIVFIWAPGIGWLIYFVMKFILSALIGLFVAPFQLGSAIANWIHQSI